MKTLQGRPTAMAGATLWLGAMVLVASTAGCHWDDDDDCYDCGPGYHPDHTPPAAPRGVTSETGDEEVEVSWLANTEGDLDGYRLYRNDQPTGFFERIATLGRATTSYSDRDVRNGRTYYYAVAAFDDAGNESDLSYELVFDTPRPEGRDLRLASSLENPAGAGFDFSVQRVVDARDVEADIYYWYSEGEGPWLVATERSADVYTDIQDAGFGSMESVGWAPDGGWAPSGDVPAIEGHVYVVWTWDDRYAKVRVVSVTPRAVVLDWAYQTDRGNPELSVPNLPLDNRPAKPAGGGLRAHRAGQEVR